MYHCNRSGCNYKCNDRQFANILTRESADRKYLEIQALSKIIGMEFGGNIQDTGNKVKGKFYYDNVTKFYYECIENTNLTYNECYEI